MNWFRGLWRLWLVVSLPWIAATFYLRSDNITAAYRDISTTESVVIDEEGCAAPQLSSEQRDICDLRRKLKRQTDITIARARDDLVEAGEWILVPPALLAFLMAAVAWVIRGFRP